MKKILIINLKRHGDVFHAQHLVNSLKKAQTDASFDILSYRESSPSIQSLGIFQNKFLIDREKIVMALKSDLFSNGIAINEFLSNLKLDSLPRYHQVINLSNDPVGTYLTSALEKDSFKGTQISLWGSVHYSNNWAIYLNEVYTQMKRSPVHLKDIQHKICDVIFDRDELGIRTNSKYNKIACDNFNKIREVNSNEGINVSIVGIQIKSSTVEKDFSKELACDLIEQVLTKHSFVPVLLIAPTDAERALSEEINTVFNNTLLIVESDFEALPSVLLNLDFLITPDTSTKHVADLCSTPTLEVNFGKVHFSKQGTIKQNNLILNAEQGKLTADEILESFLYLSNNNSISSIRLKGPSVLYKVFEDQQGAYFLPVAGDFDSRDEVLAILARQFSWYLLEDIEEYKEEVLDCFGDLTDLVDNEIKVLTSALKALLHCLRILKDNGTQDLQRQLFLGLDKVFSFSNTTSLISIPVLLFRGRLESIDSENNKDSKKAIETELYQLKSDTQKLSNFLNQLLEKKREFKNSIRKSQAKVR